MKKKIHPAYVINQSIQVENVVRINGNIFCKIEVISIFLLSVSMLRSPFLITANVLAAVSGGICCLWL